MANSTNDYDLFILNSAGTGVIGSSTTLQAGAGSDPIEEVFNPTRLPRERPHRGRRQGGAATARTPHRNLRRSLQIFTAGETHGHNAPPGLSADRPALPGAGFGVAAVAGTARAPQPARLSAGAANPTESSAPMDPAACFISRTARPITAGNFLFGTNGGIVLVKPDISAADGITARTPGFNPFFGTSAAAPHAAGVAAIVKSARPSATGAESSPRSPRPPSISGQSESIATPGTASSWRRRRSTPFFTDPRSWGAGWQTTAGGYPANSL